MQQVSSDHIAEQVLKTNQVGFLVLLWVFFWTSTARCCYANSEWKNCKEQYYIYFHIVL